MKKVLITIGAIIAIIGLNSCGPSANQVNGYVSYIENNYYQMSATTKLQEYNYSILYNNDNRSIEQMDSLINFAIENINNPKAVNEDQASFYEKSTTFFEKNPYFKNLALNFLKDYQTIVRIDLKGASELFQKHKKQAASLEDAENYVLKVSNFSNKIKILDSIYVAKKDSFLTSYGENSRQKGLCYFFGKVNNFSKSNSTTKEVAADYYNETVMIIRPLLNISMVGYEMTTGIKNTQQKTFDYFNAQIDTALIKIKFLSWEGGSYEESAINFIKKHKNEWETNAKIMVGMDREDAEKQWYKIKTVFHNELNILDEQSQKYAKSHNLIFRESKPY